MSGQSYDRQFLQLTVTCSAGTAKASPLVTSWKLGDPAYLNKLSVRVPKGHAGLTGVCVLYNGVAILPFGQPPGFLVTNDETLGQDFEQEEIAAALTVQTFNTDIFAHSFYLRADINITATSTGGNAVSVVPIA